MGWRQAQVESELGDKLSADRVDSADTRHRQAARLQNEVRPKQASPETSHKLVGCAVGERDGDDGLRTDTTCLDLSLNKVSNAMGFSAAR